MIGRGMHGKLGRPRIEMHRRSACLAIKALVLEHDFCGTKQLVGTDSPPCALFTTYFEQIGKVIVEQQRYVEACRALAVILDADPLISRSAPEKMRTHDMQH